MRRRLFWPLVALGSLFLVLAGGTFAAALFSVPLPPLPLHAADYGAGVSYYWKTTEVFGRPVSLSWASDKGFLIATILLGAVGLTTFGFAARVR